MTQITNEQASNLERIAREHNESIDRFFDITIKERFGDGEMTAGMFLNQWFEAQELINQQCFYEKGHAILNVLRALGIDCKQNMQTNKLYCPELNIYDNAPKQDTTLFG